MVPVQGGRLRELLVAVVAGIRARSTVAEDVFPQGPLGLEALLALAAQVRPGVRV